MVVLSCLRAPVTSGARAALTSLRAPSSALMKPANIGQVRTMGDHTMKIVPSRFDWNRFKDEIHFFLVLGLVPVALVVAYANVYIGPSTLADIPEDYTPKSWEYHKHPIKRWFAKYCYDSYEKRYEMTLHTISVEMEKRKLRQLQMKVSELQSTRLDYKGWYYYPVDQEAYNKAERKAETLRTEAGSA